MSLDQASYPALWQIADATGIRPEWLLPTLQLESGLNPGVANQAGFPYYGISQINGDFLAAIGVTPDDYLTWPASQQLQRVVLPYMQSAVNRYGPLRSATRVYQANFLPGTLATATSLGSVLAARGSAVYDANIGLDSNRDGVITVQDLADEMAKQLPAVQGAIANAYAVRPGEFPRDAVYGDDFGGGNQWVKVGVIVLSAAAIAYGIETGVFEDLYREATRMTRRALGFALG